MQSRLKVRLQLLVWGLLFSPTGALAGPIYEINRAIDGFTGTATLVGAIETNGKQGALAAGDIIDWRLAMFVPGPAPVDTVFGPTFVPSLPGVPGVTGSSLDIVGTAPHGYRDRVIF